MKNKKITKYGRRKTNAEGETHVLKWQLRGKIQNFTGHFKFKKLKKRQRLGSFPAKSCGWYLLRISSSLSVVSVGCRNPPVAPERVIFMSKYYKTAPKILFLSG